MHLSTRHSAADCKREARAVFAASEVPRDFDTIEVPFPERGPAQLVRWSERVRERDGEPRPHLGERGNGVHAAAAETEPVPTDVKPIASP